MRKDFVLTYAVFMFIGLWGLTSIILAGEGKWTKKASMPTARLDLSAAAANGKVYVIGGALQWNGAPISTVEAR